MSSDLMLFGTWTFPSGGVAAFRASSLSYPPSEHDEDSLAHAFAATSKAKKVSAVLSSAKSVQRFLRFDVTAETIRVRAVLSDDDWVEACARLGALARAAATLGARGHLTVLSDWTPAGRLIVSAAGASLDESKRARARDAAGEADLRLLWDERDGIRAAPARPEKKDAALAKAWAVAEAKYRATWFRGKSEAFIRAELPQLEADFALGWRARAKR